MPFDGTNLSETARALIAARDHMKEHGWCQDSLNDSDGRVCMLGALGNPNSIIYLSQVNILLSVLKGPYGHSVPRWNDAPTRRYKQVMAAWDRAIARAMKDSPA